MLSCRDFRVRYNSLFLSHLTSRDGVLTELHFADTFKQFSKQFEIKSMPLSATVFIALHPRKTSDLDTGLLVLVKEN
jgi:hypothetical protein